MESGPQGVIFYYSESGNTELASRFVAGQIRSIELKAVEISEAFRINWDPISVIGFASGTQYMDIPVKMRQFMEQLDGQPGKHAFLLNTFGMMPGKSLKRMQHLAEKKGLRVMAGFSLPMPESYPPFIAKGWGGENQPDDSQMKGFKEFIQNLDFDLSEIVQGRGPVKRKISIGLLNNLMPSKSHQQIIKEIGRFEAEARLCTRCGKCAEVCPHQALHMDGFPVFSSEQCWGCWNCFNQCPQQAIRFSGINQAISYPGPSEALKKKLNFA